MITYLENDELIISINSFGAEYTSIKGKKDNTEYLWQADSKYWKRHAPVLFPIVGRLKDDCYKIDDKIYYMEQHGFARDLEFKLLEKSFDKLVYCLDSNKAFIKNYPYKFKLFTTYFLRNNTLEIKYRIENTDSCNIYFSIGSHPGFNCPLLYGESFKDYYIEFESKEICEREYLDKDTRLYTRKRKLILNNQNILNLYKELFKSDALVFTKFKSKEVSLRNTKNNKIITLNLNNFSYLAIWSKPDEAPFICIEPWIGRADFSDSNGTFKEKDKMVNLDIGNNFECSYFIKITQ